MKVAVLGAPGMLAQATAAELARRGHSLARDARECVIYFPGFSQNLALLAHDAPIGRLVIRSHAAVYGAAAKNPGYMTEERTPLLATGAPERRWLKAEQAAAELCANWAAVRLATLLTAENEDEQDALARSLWRRRGMTIAGRDPQVQFISLEDAARALVLAAESNAIGIFNAAGEGAVPLKRVYRAAVARRLPVPKWLTRSAYRNESPERLEYNWTVSAERAARELNFRPAHSSVQALENFIRSTSSSSEQAGKISEKAAAELKSLQQALDPWGLDVEYIAAWGWWFEFLKEYYWRIDSEGLEHVPGAGRGIFVANHRGFMPLDAVMHLSLIMAARRRVIRFLIIPCLLYFPFLSNFMTKLGGLVASQDNAARLMAREDMVGIFPEGIRGTFLPYRNTYKLRDFARSAFAALAVEHQAPIIPAAVVGHAEIFPIIGRINWAWAKKTTGWPYFPIAPPFPLLPFVPLPSKWHVRILPPVPVTDFRPKDARDEKRMAGFARYVQSIVQRNIDEMRMRRKHIFWGRILNGSAPQRDPLPPALLADHAAPQRAAR